ncbi:co-chaperone p23-like domain containing protein [Babesia gibsoni]|uniref:Co-chaperone p23-like domain containing protein n=1 Tax=Babesia gibsoni TaxID=33632 RepID=A0AAD8PGF5_BABGI|nr:co-chaperone p23-like domain containing protein [Babesia gibsoni]
MVYVETGSETSVLRLSPNVLWAQTKDAVFVTVDLTSPKDVKVELKDDSVYVAGVKDSKEYECTINFFKPIKAAEAMRANERMLRLKLPKVEEESWPSLNNDGKKHWIKIDWDKWVDSDDEGDDSLNNNFDMGDFANFDQFSGMGGMPPFGDDFNDDDDDHEHDEDDDCCGRSAEVDEEEGNCGCCDDCTCGDACACTADNKCCDSCTCGTKGAKCGCSADCACGDACACTEEKKCCETCECTGVQDAKCGCSADCACGDACACTPDNKCCDTCECPAPKQPKCSCSADCGCGDACRCGPLDKCVMGCPCPVR